jgi:hypothetical protein
MATEGIKWELNIGSDEWDPARIEEVKKEGRRIAGDPALMEEVTQRWLDYFNEKYADLLAGVRFSGDGRGCDLQGFIESLTYSNRKPEGTQSL